MRTPVLACLMKLDRFRKVWNEIFGSVSTTSAYTFICRMVEDLSNLLNTGEVPNLFDASDQVSICEGVSARAKKVGMDGSRTELFSFFVSEVQRNLHIVLAFSPIPADTFRTRLRMFPSLVTATTIDWCVIHYKLGTLTVCYNEFWSQFLIHFQ